MDPSQEGQGTSWRCQSTTVTLFRCHSLNRHSEMSLEFSRHLNPQRVSGMNRVSMSCKLIGLPRNLKKKSKFGCSISKKSISRNTIVACFIWHLTLPKLGNKRRFPVEFTNLQKTWPFQWRSRESLGWDDPHPKGSRVDVFLTKPGYAPWALIGRCIWPWVSWT